MLAMSFVCAADLSPTKENNLNKIVVAKWKEMRKITFMGVAPALLVLDTIKLESVTLGDDGLLTLVGKKDEKGNKLELTQINYFAYNVTVKTSLITNKDKSTTEVKDMIIYVGPAGKLF